MAVLWLPSSSSWTTTIDALEAGHGGDVVFKAYTRGVLGSAAMPAENVFTLSRTPTATGMSQWPAILGASLDRSTERDGNAASVSSAQVLLLIPPRMHTLTIALQTPENDYPGPSTPV
ncbi:hypothetical protein NMY22_g8277 [Coprinellus aureogranulatus]|nr:hypothetical protein NMY22_g8277 [Coprinellus aureogranulatus]